MSAAKRRSKAEVEAALRAGNIWELKDAPDGLDTQVVAAAVADALSSKNAYFVLKHSQSISEEVIHSVLSRLRSAPLHSHTVFLLEAVRLSAAPLRQAWVEALKARLLLEAYVEASWGSKKVREIISTFAKSAFLPAIQAAVVADANADRRAFSRCSRTTVLKVRSTRSLRGCLLPPRRQISS